MSKDLISYGLLTLAARGLQFMLLPLLTRMFSPADYGVVDLMATLLALSSILVSLSLESAVARMWVEANDDSARRVLYTSTLVCIAGVGLLLLVLACVAMYWVPFERPVMRTIVAMTLVTTMLQAATGIAQIVLRMERRILRFALLQLFTAGLSIGIALTLLTGLGMGIEGLFVGLLTAAAAGLLLALHWTRGYFHPRPSWPLLVEALRYSLPMMPAVLAGWANAQADRLILVALLGLGAVGLYGAAAKVALIMGVVVEVFRLAWLPIALGKIDDPARDAYFRSCLAGYLATTVALGLLLASFSRELLALLTSEAYAEGYVAIPWLVGAQILLGSASITNVGMLISKRTGGNSVAAAVALMINLVLGFALVAAFGIVGSAIGGFFAALVFTCLLLWWSQRSVRLPFDLRHATAMVVLYAACSAGVLGLYALPETTSIGARAALLLVALALIAMLSHRFLRRSVVARPRLGPV